MNEKEKCNETISFFFYLFVSMGGVPALKGVAIASP
jgi:hypothetical protein